MELDTKNYAKLNTGQKLQRQCDWLGLNVSYLSKILEEENYKIKELFLEKLDKKNPAYNLLGLLGKVIQIGGYETETARKYFEQDKPTDLLRKNPVWHEMNMSLKEFLIKNGVEGIKKAQEYYR